MLRNIHVNDTKSAIKSAFLGLATGDALGVPVEFQDRQTLEANPVTDMRAYGTHHQLAGTWSDDSSLCFCLAESLCQGYDLQDLSVKFQKWRLAAYWTAYGEVFDIGISTAKAIERLRQGVEPTLAGGRGENSNGNGSLMRILPLAFFVQQESLAERYEKIREVSSLTHAHFRSVFACFVYTEFVLELLKDQTHQQAYLQMQKNVSAFIA